MTLISYTTFRQQVFNWAATNYQRFQYFWPLGGGWEAWVQAEVAAHIFQVNNTYEIEREYTIYTNGQRADWALNLQTGGADRIAVELKCQRGSDLNGTTFCDDIDSDVAKLNGISLPQGVKKSVVGIYYSNSAFKEIRRRYTLTTQNHNQYGGQVGIFVFLGGVDFL